jgi:glycosyltransferase involved in cell wall biosynthesis
VGPAEAIAAPIPETSAEASAAAAEQAGLKPYAVVYFGNDWSAENRTSSHHIARRLSSRMPLLYVEVPGLRAPKATGRDIRKLWKKLSQAFRKPTAIGPQMWCMTLPQVPFRRLPFITAFNRFLGKHLLRRALKDLGFKQTISWFTVAHAGAMAGSAKEDLVVYYCTDDYSSMPDVDHDAVLRMDEALTRRADQVFVASSTLLERKRQLTKNVTHSPHGVDVSMFGRVLDPDLPVAAEAAQLKGPVIGFFGLIEAWIDLDLIAFLARSRPSWTFLMVGRIATELGELASLPNMIFTGPKRYESLPNWTKAFDVAIIPYRLTFQVLNANPLKLREYLATGKPVVAVSTPDIEQFSDCVRIAHTPEQYLQEIESALANDTEEDRARRLRAVAAMSWDRRVDEIVALLSTRLRDRSKAAPPVTQTLVLGSGVRG